MEQLTLEGAFPLVALCDVLEVSRAGYYAWQSAAESARRQRDRELMPLICDIFWNHKRRYGARRIAVELAAAGQPCGVDRVAKLLKSQGLKAIQPQPYRPRTTDSRHTLGYSPNLLLRMSSPAAIDRIWVADITYIPLQGYGFAYLALVLDLCSRRVVGWSLADHMTETLVLDALQHAIRARQPPPNLIHHSDRGGQYASQAYRDVLRRGAMRQSMSRAANCYDNAFLESCFGTIKTELEMTEYEDCRQARSEIASYLAYYNADRRHSSLDYLSPIAFEAQLPVPR
ncbi:MAG: IS3 family transposase [Gammaproteobacteria bacterium]